MMKKLLLLSLGFFSLVQAGEEETFKIMYKEKERRNSFAPKTLKKYETQIDLYPYGLYAAIKTWDQYERNIKTDDNITLLYLFKNEVDADKILSTHLEGNKKDWNFIHIYNQEIIKKILSGYYDKAQ